MCTTADLDAALARMSELSSDLFVPVKCDVLPSAPNPLTFYREYVAMNRPCVIRNAISHWPALQRWNDHAYLRKLVGDRKISVEVTPTGLADGLVRVDEAQAVNVEGLPEDEIVFTLPHTQRCTFSEFLDAPRRRTTDAAAAEGTTAPTTTPVRYVSHQNGSLLDPNEFGGALLPDIEPELDFASAAFGQPPDASNFWMGPDEAVTSLHKDHYENIYCVLAGEKTFTLFPPTDLPFLEERSYRSVSYSQRADDSGKFDLIPLPAPGENEPDLRIRPWLSVDPDAKNAAARWPRYAAHANPLRVTVRAGEVLYLPSLWFHHVRQRADCPNGFTIAVNMWYDMRFGVQYVHHCLLQELSRLRAAGTSKRPAEKPAQDEEGHRTSNN